MRTLLSIAVLSILSSPAFAAAAPTPIPELEALALIGAGLVALLASGLRNKKYEHNSAVCAGARPRFIRPAPPSAARTAKSSRESVTMSTSPCSASRSPIRINCSSPATSACSSSSARSSGQVLRRMVRGCKCHARRDRPGGGPPLPHGQGRDFIPPTSSARSPLPSRRSRVRNTSMRPTGC